MYGHKARNALIRVLTEAPELTDLGTQAANWNKLKRQRSRKLADRLLAELWFMGFAVSARTPKDHEPAKGMRDPEVHADWRNSKLNPTQEHNPKQQDVEDRKPA